MRVVYELFYMNIHTKRFLVPGTTFKRIIEHKKYKKTTIHRDLSNGEVNIGSSIHFERFNIIHTTFFGHETKFNSD